MSLIPEADQKLVNDYLAMIAEDSKPLMALGFNSPQGLTAYRAMMAKIVPYTNPPGYKSKPVASFDPAAPLRPGLTAAIAIPHGQGPFPIMIHAHGHGLRAGHPPEYEPWIREMASHGFVVVFPDYRLQPEHSYEDEIDDMYFAATWAKNNARKISGDAERMTLGGDSAGGGLTFDLLLRELAKPDGLRFKAYASIDGVITGETKKDGSDLLTGLQPQTNLPPIFMVVGSRDQTHADAVALKAANKFMELKKDYSLSVFYGMPHDFAKFPQLRAMHEANDQLMSFLNAAVGKA
jgi:acetyl esterase/lipase